MPTEQSLCMRLYRPGGTSALEQRPAPVPGPGQVLPKVTACGVCRTDLHLIDGELPDPASLDDVHAAPLLCAGLIGPEAASRHRHATRQPIIQTLPLNRANEALDRLRTGALSGAAVLVP